MAKTKWILDPTHSELGFKVKHLMITNVSGSFKDFEGEIITEGNDFSTAQVRVKVQMQSIDTKNTQRDAHLRTSDFFEVELYPELEFTSAKVEAVDSETYNLYGNLTMKGITRPVKLTVEFNGVTKDPWGGERAGFVVTGKINRNEWGVSFNAALETGGVMLGEEVKINSEIQLIKQAVPAAVA